MMRSVNVLLAIVLVTSGLIPYVQTAYAQPEGVSYPIEELGNCGSQAECREYCGLEENWETCGKWAADHQRQRIGASENEYRTRYDVEFPIEELGNCGSYQECQEYCNSPDNVRACIEFARDRGFMSEESAERALELSDRFTEGGPGGCNTPQECQDYCEENFEACIDWAVENGHLSEEDAERAKRFGPNFEGPGGCEGPRECEAYCQRHMTECIEWAEENGMMTAEEASRARRMAQAMENGPGGCSGPRECQEYCEERPDECIQWAIDNGFIEGEEAERMRRMASAFQNGPGGCQGPRECQNYCNNQDHMQECIEWACDNEFMSQEQCDVARHFAEQGGFEGPGGCEGPEECEAYCRQNFDKCRQWAMSRSGGFDNGENNVRTGGNNLPPACEEQELGPEECFEFCRENPRECAQA